MILPRPNWWNENVTGVDLVVAGIEFEHAANVIADGALKTAFANASAKLFQAGFERQV